MDTAEWLQLLGRVGNWKIFKRGGVADTAYLGFRVRHHVRMNALHGFTCLIPAARRFHPPQSRFIFAAP